jgi:hypothetical protein
MKHAKGNAQCACGICAKKRRAAVSAYFLKNPFGFLAIEERL